MVADGAGRVIDHLRLSVTDRCDQRCTYCMPLRGVQKVARSQVFSIEEMVHVCRVLVESFGVRFVRLTGGEPLLRAGVLELTRRIASLGVDDLAMTTNATRLSTMAHDLAAAGLRRVNISLDSLDPGTYRRITRNGDLGSVVAGIDAALDAGLVPLKTNTVVLRGVNDSEVATIARWVLERGAEPRFLELMPVGVASGGHDKIFYPASEILSRLEREFESVEGPVGSTPTATMYEVRSADGIRGRVGLITPQTLPFCDRCGRIRLTTEGRLLPCLHEDAGVDLAEALRAPGGVDDDLLRRLIGDGIAMKPICRAGSRKSPMHAVGG